MSTKQETVIKTENLTKYFEVRGGIFSRKIQHVHAVDGVDLEIHKGETLGLVGESGCGKTTLGKLILYLIEPTEGTILYHGEKLDNKVMKRLRRKIQIIFQDPQASIDPHLKIRDVVGEPLVAMGIVKGKSLQKKVEELLVQTGLRRDAVYKYPFQFSGGERQRICTARALSPNPEFIILDEPTSSLDVSVQARILNLLKELQESFNLTYLFISHDLIVVKYMSDRIAVMYLGKIVEMAPSDTIFNEPIHPYSRALISAVPVPDTKFKKIKRILLKGEVPSALNPPSGCRFHPRCEFATDICKKEIPELINYKPNHKVACHHIDKMLKIIYS